MTSLEILENTGVIVDSPDAVDILYQNGAKVDGNKVQIPAHLVERSLKTAPKIVRLYDRYGENYLEVGNHNVYFGAWLENLYIYDLYTGTLKSPILNDLEYMIIICDQLPNIDWVSWAGQVSDVPYKIRDQMIFKKVLHYTAKPVVTTATDEKALSDMVEMAAVVAGGYDKLREKPFIANASEPTSPLYLSGEGVKKLMICAEKGIPFVYYPMPQAGSTAPCTVAGPLVIGNVEVLAGLVIHQLYVPGAPFIYGNIPGMMDMKTTVVSYGAPELMLNLAALADIGRFYGLPVYGTAGCSDSMELDGQLGVEFALTIMNALISGANLVHDIGVLGAGCIGSAEANIFADEIIGMARHLVCGIDINDKTLAKAVIHEVGPRGNFLSHQNTLENFRSFWYPNVFMREPVQTWISKDNRDSLVKRLNLEAKKLIHDYAGEPLNKDIETALNDLEKKWKTQP
jgi:trimethylamine--corrinoid protein Co-methyltransferase